MHDMDFELLHIAMYSPDLPLATNGCSQNTDLNQTLQLKCYLRTKTDRLTSKV